MSAKSIEMDATVPQKGSEKMLITNKFVREPQLKRFQNAEGYFPERIAADLRVLIVEGISGSGKDTLQRYLKKKIKDRDVYDYSEGEVLQSWNQLQIRGLFKLRVKFMKLFVNYIRNTLSREQRAVFLLNRFHLSAYVMTVSQHPKLEREYAEVIDILRTLPVHIFILQMDENDIEKRSLHPERSGAWQKFQQQIVKNDGFPDRVERYIWQQRSMLAIAETQKIPYSVIRLPSMNEIEPRRSRVAEVQNRHHRSVRITAADAKAFRTRRDSEAL